MIGEIKDILLNQLKFLHLTFSWVNIVEVCIIGAFLFLIYSKFIKGTQSEKLVKGIFILLFAWLFSEILIKFNLLSNFNLITHKNYLLSIKTYFLNKPKAIKSMSISVSRKKIRVIVIISKLSFLRIYWNKR